MLFKIDTSQSFPIVFLSKPEEIETLNRLSLPIVFTPCLKTV